MLCPACDTVICPDGEYYVCPNCNIRIRRNMYANQSLHKLQKDSGGKKDETVLEV